jgi:phage-related minor tail protein
LAKDSGIEASRIKTNTNREIKVASRMKRLEQTKQEVEKDVKWNQEAFDRVKKEIDDLEKKRADIKKRLPRAAQAEVDKLKQQQADFDEKMKKLDEKLAALEKVRPAGGAIKKAKGRPMKMRFIAGSKDEDEAEKPDEKPAEVKKEEPPKKDVVGDVKKVINIAIKGKQIYDKVDAFIDHLKPGSGVALNIVKEETRKDTKLTKAIEDLLDNYDEISKAEAEDKFNKIMEKIETEMRENAEKLARAGRIDKADLELMGYKDKLSKERESARERLKKRLEKTTGGAAA